MLRKIRSLGLGLGLTVALGATGLTHAAMFNISSPASLSISQAPGGVRLTQRGPTNFQYLIQATTNWQNWSLVASNVTTSPTLNVIDPTTNRTMRFYRTATLPTPFFYGGSVFNSAGQAKGAFILMARTNNTAAFMGLGFNTVTGAKRGDYADGLMVGSNNAACGTYILGAPGCLQLNTSNTVTGRFTNSSSQQTGSVSGGQKANVGIFAGAAGLYTGAVTDGHTGTARMLLCPDGSFAFYRTDSYTGKKDGNVSSMTSAGVVDVYLSGSTVLHLTGSFSHPDRLFTLIIHEEDGLISFVNLTLTEPFF